MYKSDKDIEKEFENFTIESLEITEALTCYTTKNNFKVWVTFEFLEVGEHIGGGSASITENFTINKDTLEFDLMLNNWVPNSTYYEMIELIKVKLKEVTGKDYTYLREYHKKHWN